MAFELYLSNRVRKQKQFEKYASFCSDDSLLPECTITIYEQDRDEHLFSRNGLVVHDISSYPTAYPFVEEGYYGMPWKDGVVIQGRIQKSEKVPSGTTYIYNDYRIVDLIARTDVLGAFGMYNLLLSSYQFVAVNAGSLLTHAAAVLVDGEAILFFGESGSGKSTQAEAWIEYYDAKPINYDHPCIIWSNDKPIAYGTPWGGKECFCVPVGAPVKAIVFVHKSDKACVHELRKGEAFGRLTLINSLPHIKPDMDEKMMMIVERLVQSVPSYYQDCTLNKETPEMLYKVLYGQ